MGGNCGVGITGVGVRVRVGCRCWVGERVCWIRVRRLCRHASGKGGEELVVVQLLDEVGSKCPGATAEQKRGFGRGG